MGSVIKRKFRELIFRVSSLSAQGSLVLWAITRHFTAKQPMGHEADFLALHHDAVKRSFPKTKKIEKETGFAVDDDWINNLALHTQVVRKKSELNWQHGRILYSLLRSRLEKEPLKENGWQVFETGTARGFSAICMAKAMIDSNNQGVVVTVDALPHNVPRYWNCIDDLEGQKSRRQLLAPWPSELSRVIFFQALSPQHLDRIGLDRIHFAFLDAQHTFESVMEEFDFVKQRQTVGDLIVFDDVTPGVFDGVVEAMKAIKNCGLYEVEEIGDREARGYAIARRLAA